MSRRVVRKLEVRRFQPVEERLWPTLVALAILTGMAMGTAVAYLRPDDARWYANSWTWVVAIPLGSLLATFWLVVVDRGRRRRPVQLAAVLGILVHLVLLIACLESTMMVAWVRQQLVQREPAVRPRRAPAIPKTFQPKVTPVPAEREWERPVAVEPETKVQPQKIVRRTQERPETPVQRQPRPVPQPTPTVKPERVVRDQTRPSPQAQASRTPIRREARRSLSGASQPKVAQASRSPSRPEVQPRAASAGRASAARSTQPNRTVANNERADVRSSVARAERRVEAPQVESRTMARRRARETAVASSPVDAPSARSRTPRAQVDLQPQIVAARRRTTASTETEARPTVALDPEPQRPSLVPRRREVELPRSVAQAGGKQRPRRRDTRRLAAPTTELAQNVEAASRSTASQTRIAAAALSQRRSPQATQGRAGPQARPTEQAAEPNTTPVTQTRQVARAASAGDVAVPSARSATMPRRSAELALAGSTVDELASVAAGGVQGNAEAALQPAAVHRGRTGVAGAGQTVNVQRSSAAAESPAAVASGSLPRRADMRAQEADAALHPSSRGLTPRRRSEATLAGTSAVEAPVALTESAKATRLPELAAGSAAGQRQAASDATSGPTSAMRGEAAADLGVTRVVGNAGGQRASGGGQPEVSQLVASRSEPRRGRGRGLMAPRSSAQVAAPTARGASGLSGRMGAQASEELAAADVAAGAGGARPGADSDVVAGPAAATGSAAEGVAQAAVGGAGEVVQVARSEAGGADSPEPAAGSGTGRRARRLRGPTLRVDVQADTSGIAASREGGSGRESAAVAVAAGSTGRVSGRDDTGLASPGDRAAEPEAGASISAGVGKADRVGGRRGEPAPDVTSLAGTGRRRRRSRTEGLNVGSGAALPEGIGSGSSGSGQGAVEVEAATVATTRGASEQGMVPGEGPAGVGGGVEAVSTVGVSLGRAQGESPELTGTAGRFRLRRPGGTPDINTSVVVGRRPFRQRMARLERTGPEPRGRPGELAVPTEKAIELGLLFLKRCQSGDGSWKLERFANVDGPTQFRSDTAATGLALLAFQGAGYHHRSEKYGETVGAALRFLIDHQRDDGDLYVPMNASSDQFCRLYSHGIAAIALCEAYGMTQDPALREPAQKAIDFVAASQDPENGGWRYQPRRSSDTSVTGWMVMALKSGELAGLRIPRQTMDRVERWLGVAQVDDRSSYLFCYNPYASDAQRHGRLASPTMTSVGLLMRLYAGWDRTDGRFRRGAEYLLQSPPALGGGDLVQRDTYYWYYATQVMYHVGGEAWERWYRQLYPLLLEYQIPRGELAGSWDPLRPVPDRWAAHAGRIYVTTMNLLSLEVRYRILPLYEETIASDRE